MRPQDFYVKQKAEEGRRVDLSNPDGTPSGHWMVVRSVLSSQYEEAFKQISRAALDDVMRIASAGDRAAVTLMTKTLGRSRKARLVASLIADWSLDCDCSEQEKTRLLVSAPRLRRQIERVSETIFVAGAGHD
ncbi:MAG: hypothetical protein ACOH2T_23425 [Pseudomonas sp.]